MMTVVTLSLCLRIQSCIKVATVMVVTLSLSLREKAYIKGSCGHTLYLSLEEIRIDDDGGRPPSLRN